MLRHIIFFASLVISATCFAPHYTTYGGTSYDVAQVEKVRTMIASAPVRNLQRMSPDKQIDSIRSWLAYGPGKSIISKLNVGRPADAPLLVVDIARDMGINVQTDAFKKALRSYAWDRNPK